MTSEDLTRQGGIFPQNGTIDWVRLGSVMMSFLGVGVKYNVDMFTVAMGGQMGEMLPLSYAGQERTVAAVNSLRLVTSYNAFLKFGFETQSIPHLLTNKAGGVAMLAITAALADVHPAEVVSTILHELFIQQNIPREATPPLQSWCRIVKACDGVLATSTFGTRAEQFMRLHPTETLLCPNEYSGEFNDFWRSRSAPKDIARALIEFGKIARGETESITIIGGGDTGCLAAIAVWMFDFTIAIYDDDKNLLIHDKDGELVYPYPQPGSAVQAHFIYTSRTRLDSSKDQRQHVEASKRVVRVQDVSEILFANDSIHAMQAYGRLGWECCLSWAFGSSFQKLKNRGTSFGNLLGCACRIFQAVARAEPEINTKTCKYWIYYMDTGALGFAHNMVSRFPELEDFQSAMMEGAGWNYLKARNYYHSEIESIAEKCRCLHCKSSKSQELPEGGFCLVSLSETILKASLVLSNVTIEPGLNPRRVGLSCLYDRQFQDRQKDEATRKRMESMMGPIVWVIEPEREDKDLYTVDHRIRRMVDSAMLLFTHMNGELNHTSGSAFSRSGICAYRWILKGLAISDGYGCSLARLHILPGRILWKDTAFDEIKDYYSDQAGNYRAETNNGSRINRESLDFGRENPHLIMEVQDSISYLSVSYRMLNSKGDAVYVMPTAMANLALETYGLVSCKPGPDHNCGTRTIPGDSNYHVQFAHGRETAIYRAQYPHSVFAVLAIADIPDPAYIALIDDKCIDCAISNTLTRPNRDNPFLIVSLQSR
jgi:hypothetical protein